jgi:ComF family protein
LNVIINYLFPKICCICKFNSGKDICEDCLRELPWLTRTCLTCAEPLTTEGLEQCGECLITSPPIDICVILFRYAPPISSLITGLKFGKQLLYAIPLGNLLANELVTRYSLKGIPLPECIIPMPLSSHRIKTRGYNQAMELARPIQKRLKIRIQYKYSKRVKNTAPQTLLSRQERQANVKRAFAVAGKFTYQHVAIVDDVVTTFSTLYELAKVLKKQGVRRIDVWCVAKANLEPVQNLFL